MWLDFLMWAGPAEGLVFDGGDFCCGKILLVAWFRLKSDL